jgi:hypothetical protein
VRAVTVGVTGKRKQVTEVFAEVEGSPSVTLRARGKFWTPGPSPWAKPSTATMSVSYPDHRWGLRPDTR